MVLILFGMWMLILCAVMVIVITRHVNPYDNQNIITIINTHPTALNRNSYSASQPARKPPVRPDIILFINATMIH